MPDPSLIPTVLTMLSVYPASTTIGNAYASPHLVNNLNEYLYALISYPYSGDLLVGEAPGYAGCALTGIPFTSEHLIASSSHPFLAGLRPLLFRAGTQTERSATMVWNHLARGTKLPALWNAFPFHPHPPGNPFDNRTPTTAEAVFGARVLDFILRILTPTRVFTIGRVAEAALSVHFPHLTAPYIRHPSNGGHGKFISGMTAYSIV
jgi:uracil-DNA glycosylase